MGYTCAELNCQAEAKMDGMCVKHACEDAKRRVNGTMTKEREERKPVCGRCGKEKPDDKRFSFKSERCSACRTIEACKKKKLAASVDNRQKAEGRRQKAEGRRQKAEGRKIQFRARLSLTGRAASSGWTSRSSPISTKSF